MNSYIKISICSTLAFIITSCQTPTKFPSGLEKLLTRMQSKVDPLDKIKTINTKVIKGNLIKNSKDQNSTITLKIKRPNKIRFDIVVPGQFTLIKGFDGTKGWVFNTKFGSKELEGYPYDYLKFQAAFLDPARDFKKIFSSISFAGKYKVAGDECYKLICKPNSTYNIKPISIFVDIKTALIKKRITIQGSEETGFFEISTIFDDYRSVDGILVPYEIISQVKDTLMEYKVTSVKWNETINDSTFTLPENLK
jgi:outer membrane lipoprotein-sorting protein